jgi:inner membrane protein
MAAARLYGDGTVPRWSSLTAWSALSLLPDLDVIGFSFGIRYGDVWGHRGAAHAFLISIAVGLAAGLIARGVDRSRLRLALFATVVIASHPILDTMTDGGLGCALLWPFSLTRYFAPWRPIPVAPIGSAFLTEAGALVALTEVVLFAPVLAFALWPRRLRPRAALTGVLLGLWLASVWLLSSDDRVREGFVGFLVREDTAYTNGFSEDRFRRIFEGQPQADVRRLLGTPYAQTWFYPSTAPVEHATAVSVASLPHECVAIAFESGLVVRAFDAEACRTLGIVTRTTLADVESRKGRPPESCWAYSWSPSKKYHRLRMVCFSNGSVDSVLRRWAHAE